jgi:hypothetical protein
VPIGTKEGLHFVGLDLPDSDGSLLPPRTRPPPVDIVADSGSGPCDSRVVPNFFQLPCLPPVPQRRRNQEPLMDYSKSIIMTSEEYLKAMEEKAQRREDA